MDINQTLDNNFGAEFSLNSEIRSYLKETAKWAYFLSIVGFVFLALMIIFGLSFGSLMGMAGTGEMDLPVPTAFFTVLYLGIAALYFFPVLYLYRFSSKMKMALSNEDDLALTEAFSGLKSHYKFLGIFTAVIVGLYGLLFIFAMLGGAMSFLG